MENESLFYMILTLIGLAIIVVLVNIVVLYNDSIRKFKNNKTDLDKKKISATDLFEKENYH